LLAKALLEMLAIPEMLETQHRVRETQGEVAVPVRVAVLHVPA
jgi:hypothetical protein